MADYCTAAELKAEIGISDSEDDTEIGTAITAASRKIDAYCGRKFSQDANVVEREFYPDSPLEVDLLEQPYQSAASEISTLIGLIVKTDEADDGTFSTTLTINTDFLVLPRNAAADGWPWSGLLAVGSGSFPMLSSGRAGVQVTAKFGWATIPTDVKKACLLESARLFRRKDSPEGVLGGFAEFGPVRVSQFEDPDARRLLSQFRRVAVG